MTGPSQTLLGLGIRGRRGDGRRHRGLLRRSGGAASGFFRVTAVEQEQGGDGNAGQDDGFFHNLYLLFGCLTYHNIMPPMQSITMGCYPTI